MATAEELLKVLDMSKEEQWVFCTQNGRKTGESLADLAFRLRDEVKYIHRCSFVKAVLTVYWHCTECRRNPQDETLWRWFSREAQPIHWIIAALIALKK